MFDYRKLRGKITEVFGNQQKFAEALGMSYVSLNQRLTNRLEWKAPEIMKACELLGIPLAEAHVYFFTRLV